MEVEALTRLGGGHHLRTAAGKAVCPPEPVAAPAEDEEGFQQARILFHQGWIFGKTTYSFPIREIIVKLKFVNFSDVSFF